MILDAAFLSGKIRVLFTGLLMGAIHRISEVGGYKHFLQELTQASLVGSVFSMMSCSRHFSQVDQPAPPLWQDGVYIAGNFNSESACKPRTSGPCLRPPIQP